MVAGVKYQITKLDGSIVGEYTSDAAGLLYMQLEPGWYVIKMVELPDGCKGYTLTMITVPAGFKVVTTPIFYNYVMPTIPNGFLIITRSECGGKVGDAWKTVSALWTTTVINKGGAGVTGGLLPSQLPKTGY